MAELAGRGSRRHAGTWLRSLVAGLLASLLVACDDGVEKEGCPAEVSAQLAEVMRNSQAIISIVPTEGRNLRAISESMSMPGPAPFRALSASLGEMGAAVPTGTGLDTVASTRTGLDRLADHLEAALSSPAPDTEAWKSLEAYANANLLRLLTHANSIVDRAGCLQSARHSRGSTR